MRPSLPFAAILLTFALVNAQTASSPPSPPPTPSSTPTPVPQPDPCVDAVLSLYNCHTLGPVNATSPWTSPEFGLMGPYEACCDLTPDVMQQCGGLQGLLLDWGAIVGATNDITSVVEAYLKSCPGTRRDNLNRWSIDA
jgi:hypothetical protein